MRQAYAISGSDIKKTEVMIKTPSSERLHIAITGKCNTGKSSLMNALTGQKTAIVSDIPGTTADPVRKAMEIPGIGPCLFIDTAGFDDSGTALGRKRTGLSAKALESADIAIMIFRDCDNAEKEWYGRMTRDGIPVIPVIGKADLHGGTGKDAAVEEEVRKLCGESPVMASAATLQGIDLLFRAILEKIPGEFGSRTITGDLVKEGDTILLVMPQDGLAPKGRLILPQVQVIRELLDRKCTAVSCTPDTMGKALASLACPPGLIITDSQAFEEVAGMKPEGSRLTSFSILFAGYKGDIRVFREGAEALGRLGEKSRVLIAEACTHAPAEEDIGRVRIPALLRRRFGQGLRTEVVSGKDFPDDLSGYDIVIHCGACMFNRRYVLSRIASAERQHVPITNYGMAIAWLKGILGKVTFPGTDR